MKTLLLISLLFCFQTPQIAYAYLDPGTGSMLLQIVLGGVAGLIVIAKMYWNRIKGLFSKQTQHRKDPSESDD